MKTLLSMKKYRESRKRIPFFSLLDLMTVEEDGLIVGVSGKTGYGYRLNGVDYLLWDEDKIENFFGELKKFLNQIPEGIVLNFQRRSQTGDPELLARYESSVTKDTPLTEEIVREKLKAFREQRFLKKELFLFVVYSPEKVSGKRSSVDPGLAKRALKNFENLLGTSLSKSGVLIQGLTREAVIRFYFEKLNPDLSRYASVEQVFNGDEKTYPFFETLRSRVLLSAPEVKDDSLYLDGFYHAAANLRLLPEEASLGMVKRFESLIPEDSDWTLTIQKPDEEKETQKMRVRANFAKANAFFRVMEDHDAHERAREYEAFLHEKAEKNEHIFEISLSVLVKARTEEKLRTKKETVLKSFSKLGGAIGIFEHFEHDVLFLSELPLQGDENPVKFSVLTDALSRLLPLCEEWKGTACPEILLKTYQDEGLSLDLFDPSLPAKHAVMIGSTGSGKSFTTNFLLTHFLIADQTHHVVVIDIGGSYRKLASIFEGGYLEIDCSEEYALNPFFEKKTLFPKENEFDSDLLAFLTTLLEKMVTEREKLTTGDLRILEKAILQVYKVIAPDKTPLLQDVQNVLRNYSLGDEEDRKRAYHFAKNLSLWTEGRFGKLLNRPGTLSLDNRLLIFDLARLAAHPELQSIVFFVIRSVLSRKLYDLSLKKMIVIDEGWRFFNDEIGSRLIEELYRTARKTNSLILSISQSPEDFLNSNARTAILANSFVKYVLKLQKGHEVLSKFGLGESEIQAIRELEVRPGWFSELFIQFFERSVVAKIEPSSLDYWIATTDPDDFSMEQKLRLNSPVLSNLEVLRGLGENHPRGVRKAAQKEDHS